MADHDERLGQCLTPDPSHTPSQSRHGVPTAGNRSVPVTNRAPARCSTGITPIAAGKPAATDQRIESERFDSPDPDASWCRGPVASRGFQTGRPQIARPGVLRSHDPVPVVSEVPILPTTDGLPAAPADRSPGYDQTGRSAPLTLVRGVIASRLPVSPARLIGSGVFIAAGALCGDLRAVLPFSPPTARSGGSGHSAPPTGRSSRRSGRCRRRRSGQYPNCRRTNARRAAGQAGG